MSLEAAELVYTVAGDNAHRQQEAQGKPRRLVRNDRIGRSQSESPQPRKHREPVPGLEQGDQRSQRREDKDRRLDPRKPFYIGERAVLRVVFAACFGPDHICLDRAFDAAGIGKERREKENAHVNKKDHRGSDQQQHVGPGAELFIKRGPGNVGRFDQIGFLRFPEPDKKYYPRRQCRNRYENDAEKDK